TPIIDQKEVCSIGYHEETGGSRKITFSQYRRPNTCWIISTIKCIRLITERIHATIGELRKARDTQVGRSKVFPFCIYLPSSTTICRKCHPSAFCRRHIDAVMHWTI